MCACDSQLRVFLYVTVFRNNCTFSLKNANAFRNQLRTSTTGAGSAGAGGGQKAKVSAKGCGVSFGVCSPELSAHRFGGESSRSLVEPKRLFHPREDPRRTRQLAWARIFERRGFQVAEAGPRFVSKHERLPFWFKYFFCRRVQESDAAKGTIDYCTLETE